MRKSKKKLLAMLLAGTMVFGMLPSNVFADNEQTQTPTVVDETATTDESTNLDEEDTNQDTTEVEASVEETNSDKAEVVVKTEEASLEDDANTESAVDLSVEEIKLQKTEEIKAGEKYIIIYDNKKALAIGKDSIIAVPVEVEEDIIKTEITKNIIWTVDDNNNLVSELGNDLLLELNLQQERQSLEFNAKNISYVNQEVNTYLAFNEETKKWSFEENQNTNINYYSVTGYTTTLRELSNEELIGIEEESKENQIKQDSDIQSYDESEVDSVLFDVILYDYVIDKDSEFKFTDTAYQNSNDLVNGYNGNNEGRRIVQGLVENRLDNGNIKFNYESSQDLFRVYSSENLRKENVFTGVKFPFIKDENGYYTFDSSEYHVHSNKENNEELDLYANGQSFGDNESFFPFNTHNDETPNYFFGMNLGINFYMTNDGKINIGNGNTQNMIFEFSGDDDVWVFVDGKLVLDLGGIHQPVYGKIDFCDGIVTYGSDKFPVKNYIYDVNGEEAQGTQTDYGLTQNLWNLLGVGNINSFVEDPTQLHTLQVFYLERGAGDSNCMIRFNMPQKDTLDVTKQLASGTPIPKKDEFTFSLMNGEDPYKNERYYLYNGTSICEGGPYYTDEYGKFTLQSGYTAKFIEPEDGTYTIEEIEDRGYSTNWIIGNNSTDGKKATVTIKDTESNDMYYATCINSADFTLEHDIIVVDYGKPIRFNVIENDNFKPDTLSDWKFIGIRGENSTADFTDKCQLGNGELYFIDSKGTLEYKLTKFFDTINKATYAISYEAINDDTSQGQETRYKYANITIMPATTVYYEDNFGVTVDNSGKVTSSTGIQFSENWTKVSEGNVGATNQDSGLVVGDKGQSEGLPYGYDNSYSENDKFSNGSAMKIIGNENGTSTANFIFKGTGFDIIGRTDTETGIVRVRVYEIDSNGDRIKEDNSQNDKIIYQHIVDTVYSSGILYQIPVINWNSGTFGTYEVELTIGNGQIFYLDAVRLYNPLGNTKEQMGDVAYKQYGEDNELNANIREVRNLLISNADKTDGLINGIAYVDSVTDGVNSVTDYTKIGPNNEVYLMPGQMIAFKINNVDKADSVQISLKSPDSKSAKIEFSSSAEDGKVKEIELHTSTSMYYDITEVANDKKGVIYINNISEEEYSIVSISNLKITCNSSGEEFEVTVDKDIIITANMLAYESSKNKSADIDGNGKVDIFDLANISNNQGKKIIMGVSTDIYKQDLTASRDIDRDDLNIVKDSLE